MFHNLFLSLPVWALLAQSITARNLGSYGNSDSSYGNSHEGFQGDAYSSWTSAAVSTKFNVAASSSCSTSAFSANTNVPVPSLPPVSSVTSIPADGPSSVSTKNSAATSVAASPSSNTVVYDWNIGWVTAAPDGFARPVIGVNGQW